MCSVLYARLVAICWQIVKLFDIYKGKQVGAGEKSLAFKLVYQAPNKTLNDKEATKLRNKIVRMLENDLGAKLRSQ